MRSIRIGLVQMNSRVGDLEGNTRRIIGWMHEAREAGVDLVVFPELAITGYPPEDLLMRPSFIRGNRLALERIVSESRGLTAVLGFVDADASDIYNAAAVVHDGGLAGVHHKVFLPNYGVFDEDRYFSRGTRLQTFTLDGGLIMGAGVCEDIWYPDGPAHAQCLVGNAHLIVNINASPFHAGKWTFREKMLATRATDNTCFVVWVNMVGGQDELVFDGHSLVFDPKGELRFRGQPFHEQFAVVELEVLETTFHSRLQDPRRRKKSIESSTCSAISIQRPAIDTVVLPPLHRHDMPLVPTASSPAPGRWDEIYQALVVGVRDYVDKNGFKSVVVGLSGGIDSALTATVAVDALGPARVCGVALPSQYNLSDSLEDAQALAQALEIEFHVIPIQPAFESLKVSLRDTFGPRPEDITEENLQARVRGTILMALSNKMGHMVLTTGNKSEVAVGYCTLYGDMVGGFAVLKDVPKTWVYELSRYRNTQTPVIPDRTITRAPSAELRPDQTDQDSLPPYEVLDAILELYIEQDHSESEIISRGFAAETVQKVIGLVDRNEYKRRQAAPGIKITPKAFGKDRRLPITNLYREGAP
ncbi:MAG TPA: NAD+ synthase [Candidatus Xenobia bacterium]